MVFLQSQYLDSSVQNLYGNDQGGGRFGATIVNLGDINKDNIDGNYINISAYTYCF